MLPMRPRGPAPGPLMLLMRAWGSRAGPADAHDARPLGASVATQKTTKKKPFTGGTRGSAALASGLILLRRRPEASKAIPGTTGLKGPHLLGPLGTSRCPIFKGLRPWAGSARRSPGRAVSKHVEVPKLL